MKNTVTMQYDEKTKEHYLDLDDVLKGTNVEVKSVDSYKIIGTEAGFILELFDKNGKRIKVRDKYNIDDLLKDLEAYSLEKLWMHFTVFGVTFLFWKKWEFGYQLCETEPYARDGDVPIVFLLLGFIEIAVENSWLYRRLYKKRYGVSCT